MTLTVDDMRTLSAIGAAIESELTTTCDHRERGLCPDCAEWQRTDPEGWNEYGIHPAGNARYAKLKEELAGGGRLMLDWTDIPF